MRLLTDPLLSPFRYIVSIPKTESLQSVMEVPPFEIMYSNCITTNFNGIFFSQGEFSKHKQEKSNQGFRNQSTCCPQQHLCCQGPHFPFQSLNLSPFYSYAFSSSHFNGLFHHILKNTSLEDTAVCSASNIFITFYYNLGSREVLYLIWRACPVSFTFLQDFYQANLIQV